MFAILMLDTLLRTRYTQKRQEKAPWQKEETYKPKVEMEYAPKSRPAPWLAKGGADPSFAALGGGF